MSIRAKSASKESLQVKKHKDLADSAHLCISKGLDLEGQNGDIVRILTLYLDGIDCMKLGA